LRDHALGAADALATMPRTEAFGALQEATKLDARGATQLLWDAYQPWRFWITWCVLGLVSAAAMIAFARNARRHARAWYV
jgi:hypothetical protein